MNDFSTIQQHRGRLVLDHRTRAGDLWPVVLKNAVLNILTLWFYRFWGRTNVRRVLWQKTTLNGEPFEYTGTGKELFIGFLIIFFVVLLPLYLGKVALDIYTLDLGLSATVVSGAGLYALILFLIGFAIYRAQRYRMTRTMWRGIRGTMTGKASAYAFRYFGYFVLSALTLGLAYPFGRMRVFGRLMSETGFGDRRFSFEGSSRPLYKRFLVVWLSTIVFTSVVFVGGIALAAVIDANAAPADKVGPIIGFFVVIAIVVGIGLAMLFYRVREMQHFANCTRFEGLSFGFDATAWSLLRLAFGNLLITLLTLGFGVPFAQMRVFRYFCDRLTIDGSVDIDAIIQSSAEKPSFGEGLADAFDMGAV